jgi:hypothetical protein
MEIDKKQAGTIFIAAIFIISGISFALSWTPPKNNTVESTGALTQPIANEQRNIFISNDVTVLTLFYLPDNLDSQNVKQEVEKLNEAIGEKLLVEEIDVSVYGTFSAEYNVKTVPVILVRGKENKNTPVRLEGSQSYDTIKERVCSSYTENPEFCG